MVVPLTYAIVIVSRSQKSGNRFDDPNAHYRVLYACSQPVGCFLETLARFAPDPAVIAGLAETKAKGASHFAMRRRTWAGDGRSDLGFYFRTRDAGAARWLSDRPPEPDGW